MFGIGPQELVLILVIALIVVGPRRLPEIGRSIGKGLREIRKAQDEVRKTIHVDFDEEPAPPPARTPPARSRRASAVPADEDNGEASGGDLAAAAGAASTPVAEVSKTLGKGLAELRKARQEIQRTFRVDLDEPPRRPSSAARTDEDGATDEPRTTDGPGTTDERDGGERSTAD